MRVGLPSLEEGGNKNIIAFMDVLSKYTGISFESTSDDYNITTLRLMNNKFEYYGCMTVTDTKVGILISTKASDLNVAHFIAGYDSNKQDKYLSTLFSKVLEA